MVRDFKMCPRGLFRGQERPRRLHLWIDPYLLSSLEEATEALLFLTSPHPLSS